MDVILDVRPSSRKGKRYMAVLGDESKIHFGLRGGSTFIDHRNLNLRNSYIARHYGSKAEKELIDTLTPSPSLFSMYLLWSFANPEINTLEGNVKVLNNILKHKNEPIRLSRDLAKK
jgi:hypothetical protein